ncbi:MAG: hypothetical protein QM751_09055 [Paludibacteraceae bacterium]
MNGVTEKVIAMLFEPNKFLVSWVEKSGLGVIQFLDFGNLTVHSIIRNGEKLHTEKGNLTLLSIN